MSYDEAGRLELATATGNPTGTTYVMNCYDGTANPGPDGSANSDGGGSVFKGRLTKTMATDFIPTIGPQIMHDYQYIAASGRVGTDVTKIGNGGLSSTFTQSWTYGSQARGMAIGHEQ